MSSIQVRPFHRNDRELLTRLVNAHTEAVVPGMGVSVNTVLGSLERRPEEFIEDPWVSERVTLVTEQHHRVAAAAHLLRYFSDERAGPAVRGTAEICWLLYWPDAAEAADVLMAACTSRLRQWGVTRQYAGGELPAPGVYGVPEQWPHIRALYQRAGFTHTGHTEIVYLARVQDLPGPAEPAIARLSVRRSVGTNGCRLSAVLGQEIIGYIEIETLNAGERLARHGGWAEIGDLRVTPPYRRQGIGSWLLGQAADWLRLAEVTRLLDYAWLEGTDSGGNSYDAYRAFLDSAGFRELTRTARSWTRDLCGLRCTSASWCCVAPKVEEPGFGVGRTPAAPDGALWPPGPPREGLVAPRSPNGATINRVWGIVASEGSRPPGRTFSDLEPCPGVPRNSPKPKTSR